MVRRQRFHVHRNTSAGRFCSWVFNDIYTQRKDIEIAVRMVGEATKVNARMVAQDVIVARVKVPLLRSISSLIVADRAITYYLTADTIMSSQELGDSLNAKHGKIMNDVNNR